MKNDYGIRHRNIARLKENLKVGAKVNIIKDVPRRIRANGMKVTEARITALYPHLVQTDEGSVRYSNLILADRLEAMQQ